jgi:sugar (pentulose or hexulose) kinase
MLNPPDGRCEDGHGSATIIPSREELFLGIDGGTSAVKTVVVYTVDPDPALSDLVAARIVKYRALYRALRELFKEISK